MKEDGSELTAEDHVGPINLMLHSLFSQVDVSLNERVVSSSCNTYPYRAYIETLLNYGDDAKKTFLSSEGFYSDTPGHLHLSDPKDANQGLKKRSELIAKSRTLDLIGNLHCDIFYQNRLMLNLVDIKIKLIRSKPSFFLISNMENPQFKVVIEHASLFVRRVKVNPGILIAHAKALEKTSAKYPTDRVLCKVYSLSQGSMSFVQDNVFTGQMPKRIIVTCVDHEAFNGSYKSNPYHFAHHDLNFIAVYVNGNPVPHKPIEPDYPSHLCVRAYNSLFQGTEKQCQDKGIQINREDYEKGFTLYAFDLTPDLCDDGHMNLMHQGNLRLEMKFVKPLPKTISVIVYSEFQNVIEITKSRNVLCDFSN